MKAFKVSAEKQLEGDMCVGVELGAAFAHCQKKEATNWFHYCFMLFVTIKAVASSLQDALCLSPNLVTETLMLLNTNAGVTATHTQKSDQMGNTPKLPIFKHRAVNTYQH